MQRFIIFILSLCFSQFTSAQSTANSSKKIGWYLSLDYSAMLHNDHVGHAPGFQAGISVLERRLQLGFFYYGRSGPINGQAFDLPLPDDIIYKGKSDLEVRADHGVFGLVISPQFKLSEKWKMDVPIMVGQMGAGFYLFGEDRITPDGRRVSEWENELMGGIDAGFSLHFEGGVRFKRQLQEHGNLLLGVHYAYTPQWETFVGGTEFYNVPRISLGLEFGQ